MILRPTPSRAASSAACLGACDELLTGTITAHLGRQPHQGIDADQFLLDGGAKELFGDATASPYRVLAQFVPVLIAGLAARGLRIRL